MSSPTAATAAAPEAVVTQGVDAPNLPGVRYVSAESPVVLLRYEDLTSGQDLTPSLKEAYGEQGLGILVVSGVPSFVSLRARLLPLARRFALLPEDVKAKYEHPQSHYSFGWSHGKEQLAGKPDLAKGSYYANPIHNAPFPDEPALVEKFPSFCAPNIWPSAELPQLEAAFMALGRLVCDTGALLAAHCDQYAAAVNPAYEPRRLERIIRQSRTHKARLLHYFPMTVEAAADAAGVDVDGSWCGWHNDHGSLTGLCSAMFIDSEGNEIANPDPHSGLYIRSRTGATVKAVIPADCLAFQMGETQQVHSCGALQATPHCVMAGRVPRVSRETFAVFMEPQPEEAMSVPSDADHTRVTGGTNDFLPKGVPPLKARWNSQQDFGQFTKATLDAYYPAEQQKQ